MIPLIAFLLTFCALVVLLKTNLANFALDAPNHRSLHSKAIPRTGGLALMLGVLLSLCLLGMWLWAALLLALLLVSLLDDVLNLPVHWRFAAQLLVSAIFTWIFMPNMAWYTAVAALLALVWVTNLFNFMDGSDGLAGGMAVFGFIAYALAANWAGNAQLASLCACVSAACLAFLCFNFHPAKIFMGDAGSIPLGFLAGALGLFGWQQGVWPVWFCTGNGCG